MDCSSPRDESSQPSARRFDPMAALAARSPRELRARGGVSAEEVHIAVRWTRCRLYDHAAKRQSELQDEGWPPSVSRLEAWSDEEEDHAEADTQPLSANLRRQHDSRAAATDSGVASAPLLMIGVPALDSSTASFSRDGQDSPLLALQPGSLSAIEEGECSEPEPGPDMCLHSGRPQPEDGAHSPHGQERLPIGWRMDASDDYRESPGRDDAPDYGGARMASLANSHLGGNADAAAGRAGGPFSFSARSPRNPGSARAAKGHFEADDAAPLASCHVSPMRDHAPRSGIGTGSGSIRGPSRGDIASSCSLPSVSRQSSGSAAAAAEATESGSGCELLFFRPCGRLKRVCAEPIVLNSGAERSAEDCGESASGLAPSPSSATKR
eukprot:TRINITY_DN9608_c0_g1_i3.p1 TRINITY_DN9608_c0_g1~~TRINITY_DN9608_c0_g1_i3.p1  ORF type:complete len:382 (-),score=47.18 TRINITY_DN9608_c0_g1_i3:569-1714(-)